MPHADGGAGLPGRVLRGVEHGCVRAPRRALPRSASSSSSVFGTGRFMFGAMRSPRPAAVDTVPAFQASEVSGHESIVRAVSSATFASRDVVPATEASQSCASANPRSRWDSTLGDAQGTTRPSGRARVLDTLPALRRSSRSRCPSGPLVPMQPTRRGTRGREHSGRQRSRWLTSRADSLTHARSAASSWRNT